LAGLLIVSTYLDKYLLYNDEYSTNRSQILRKLFNTFEISLKSMEYRNLVYPLTSMNNLGIL